MSKNEKNFWEKCNRCKYFDGYDICLHKKNFGPVTDVTKENCENNGFFIEKQDEQKPTDKVDVLMSLDEAIEHCKKKSCGNNACALEHKQLEKWLTELKELKEQKPFWSEEDWRTPLRFYKNGYEQGKRDVLKDLLTWKKCDDNLPYSHIGGFNNRYLIKNGYCIKISDLEILPKEE